LLAEYATPRFPFEIAIKARLIPHKGHPLLYLVRDTQSGASFNILSWDKNNGAIRIKKIIMERMDQTRNNENFNSFGLIIDPPARPKEL